MINEFMASNGSKPPLGEGELLDTDGDSSDWIELHNPTSRAVDLGGWYLTDDPKELTRWRFPAGTRLAPNAYLVVFASGKNRTSGQLHTNFKLNSDGGYLALVQSDGRTIAHECAPAYPVQMSNISYGLTACASQFVAATSTLSYHVPTSEDAGLAWTAPDFDATGWPTTQASLGFSPTSQLVGRDIGNPRVPGFYTPQGPSVLTVLGGGADIGGTFDSFYFLFVPLQGDGELTVQVIGMVNTNPWAKAGVMIRETLTAG
ncbi:MAG TPA: lamin tail domain-containing protein, partial [Sedimentisphaerales bacterium]|nr:lamin tail domain-containing protein [Sedimentisphaerales bacterium]